MRKKKIQILLSAAAFLFLMGGTMPSVAQERKIGRVERRADRNFIRQKFDKAMAQYETAIRREKDEAGQAALHLKTARLYFMVREYGRASEHYDKAMSLRPDLLGVDDVCDYVDALRFQGQALSALSEYIGGTCHAPFGSGRSRVFGKTLITEYIER